METIPTGQSIRLNWQGIMALCPESKQGRALGISVAVMAGVPRWEYTRFSGAMAPRRRNEQETEGLFVN